MLTQKEECTGCMACYNICPTEAIEIKKDEDGFYSPEINETKCINCHACSTCCPVKSNTQKLNVPILAFAGCSQKKMILKDSSSGGIFTTIAYSVLKQQGIVYGATLQFKNGAPNVFHKRITDLNELHQIQGSKYIQSTIGKIYQQVLNDLKNERIVLFSGTPCQIAALYSFLDKKQANLTNLFSIDIICHGIPSICFFNEYTNYLSKKMKKTISGFSFRSKYAGWGQLIAEVKFEDDLEKFLLHSNKSSYYSFFLKGYIYRNSCYNCKFAGMERIGDLTIGDYWGVQSEETEKIENHILDLNTGVSCIFINKLQGLKLIKLYGNKLNIYKTNEIKIAKHNNQLIRPSKKHPLKRKILFSLYSKNYFLIELLHKTLPFIF